MNTEYSLTRNTEVSDILNTGDRSQDDPSPADDTGPLHNGMQTMGMLMQSERWASDERGPGSD